MDERDHLEFDFLKSLTQVRKELGLDTEISDADHDIAKVVADLNINSPHVTVKETD